MVSSREYVFRKSTLKIGFVSLGCPKNLVDSEVMMGQLVSRGHELTPHPDQADVLVVNTCSFIDPAKQESVDTILEMAEYKKIGRAKKLIVAGCLVERYRGDIRRDMPEVDALIGTNELDRIAGLCEGWAEQGAADPAPAYLYHDLTPRVLATPGHYAYIKIAEGCDHPCTFCVIPQYRGKFRSRRFESVIAEAARLFQQGVREINLIGQDTTCFGEDLGIQDGLALLLARLAQIETPREKWIRFLYAYPNKVTQKLLDTMAAHTALVKYIDMPLQHASAAVLKRMKRGASGDIFLKLIERIRRSIPGVAIRTSFIVGFPGETDARFRRVVRFCKGGRVRPPGGVLVLRRRHQRQLCAGWQGGRAHHLQSQAAFDGGAAQDRARAQSQAGRVGSDCAGVGCFGGDRSVVGRAHAYASAGDRRRDADQRFRGRRPASGADSQAAHHRSARL